MSQNILVFDDSVELLEIFNILFSMNGYKVRTALNITMFKHHMNNRYPDIILLDVLLAGQDGRVICRQLKTDKRTKHIPIILISANPKTLNDYQEYFADNVLEKPFDIQTLIIKINEVMSINATMEKLC